MHVNRKYWISNNLPQQFGLQQYIKMFGVDVAPEYREKKTRSRFFRNCCSQKWINWNCFQCLGTCRIQLNIFIIIVDVRCRRRRRRLWVLLLLRLLIVAAVSAYKNNNEMGDSVCVCVYMHHRRE